MRHVRLPLQKPIDRLLQNGVGIGDSLVLA
jgi:hypothetical protein